MHTVTKLFSHTTHTYAQLGLYQDDKKFIEWSELFQIVNNWFDIFNSKTPHKDSRPLSQAYGFSLLKQNESSEEFNCAP